MAEYLFTFIVYILYIILHYRGYPFKRGFVSYSICKCV